MAIEVVRGETFVASASAPDLGRIPTLNAARLLFMAVR